MRPSITAIFATFLLLISSLTLSAQNPYTSIAEMKAKVTSNKEVTIESAFTIVGISDYTLLYDGENYILTNGDYFRNLKAKSGDKFYSIKGIYYPKQ